MLSLRYKQKNTKVFVIAFLLVLLSCEKQVFAETAEEIKSKIDSHAEQIKKLDDEIKIYQTQIEETGKQANTLQNAIKSLDINQQKIGTEIKKTETNISKVALTINQLGQEIQTTESKINTGKEAIRTSLREVNETDDISLVEIMLGSGSLASTLDTYQESERFNDSVRERSRELLGYKADVEDKKSDTEKKKGDLVNLQGDLQDQNAVLDNNKKEKNSLLSETKNKETEYKKVLTQKQAQKEQFEKELFDFESKLKIAVDPNSFSSAKKGIFSWPLDSVYVTQGFGKTVDSKKLYTTGTHNGVDFRAVSGTPVKSIGDGIVQATGNTDLQKGCYSYGKWVLIKHTNGLSSLYGHFSVIKANPGEQVAAGDVIGYSGATGYATGPHLHLTLYASEAVQVSRYTSSINCKNVDIPIAPAAAYLDPLSYLPAL